MPRPLIKPRTRPLKASSEPLDQPSWVSAAAVIDGCALFAGGTGTPMSKSSKTEMLGKLRSGADDAPHELELEAVTFIQRETPNRNFVRFKPGMLAAFAKSFEGQPMLRDHDSRSMLSRGGTIIASKLEHNEDGSKQIRQRMKLVKPWSIEAALDGTLDRFSIGWSRTAPVECSVCGNALMSNSCSHWPGEATADGKMCEALFTGADGTEVSGVNVPAVTGTRIESISQLDAIDAESLACILGETTTGSVPGSGGEEIPDKDEPMKDLAALAAILGLAATATEEQILEAADANAKKLKIAEGANAETATRLAVIEADNKRRIDEERASVINTGLAKLVAAGKMKPGDSLEEKKLREFAAQSLEVFQYAIDTKLASANVTPVGAPTPGATIDPNPKAATALDAAVAANPHLKSGIKQLQALGYDSKEVESAMAAAIARQEEAAASRGR